MNLLTKEIKCDKFLTIVRKTLSLGYLDPTNGKIVTSDLGTPQGSVLNPLLANIVLHELDKYIFDHIVPNFHRGNRRRTNPVYNKIIYARDPKNPKTSELEKKQALKLIRNIPRNDPLDPSYRRSMYIRYADDFVFLFEGPKNEALIIKEQIKKFL